jgi:hypothetical protein
LTLTLTDVLSADFAQPDETAQPLSRKDRPMSTLMPGWLTLKRAFQFTDHAPESSS